MRHDHVPATARSYRVNTVNDPELIIPVTIHFVVDTAASACVCIKEYEIESHEEQSGDKARQLVALLIQPRKTQTNQINELTFASVTIENILNVIIPI
jgi:hypothetical protein